jgi:predicted  nucleic acid-binding Zn-ribbon protein
MPATPIRLAQSSSASAVNINQQPVPSFTVPSSLTTVSASALLNELAASTAACERVDKELDELMSQRGELERALSRAVPSFLEQVESLRRTQTNVNATVQSSAASAHALSSKVRDLDLSASNVQAALQRVESVLSLRHTITRVREKLSAGTLGSAGEELYQALFVQTPIVGDMSFLMLLELERKAREELHAQTLQRYVRQARNTEAAASTVGGRNANQPQSTLESTPIFKLARIWPKLGCNYRGLVMHCAQVRHECLAAINRSGWTVANQVEGALIDYARNVRNIIDTCNAYIVQHLLVVQNTFGPGAQIRLVQELLINVIDVEVATKLIGRMMEERKLKEPPKGSQLPADDICSRIKRINQSVMSGSSHRTAGGELVVSSYYDPNDSSVTNSSSPLHIQRLDELLEELRALAHDMEDFLKGVNSLARQSLDFLAEAVSKETQAREEKSKQAASTEPSLAAATTPNSNSNSGDEAFSRFLSNPQDLSTLPSVHQQHDRVMTLLHKLLSADKGKKNLLDIPLVDDRSNVFTSAKPSIAPDAIIPPAQLNLPNTSPFLVHGFGLESNLATASQLYDVLLTLIGKYVLVEEVGHKMIHVMICVVFTVPCDCSYILTCMSPFVCVCVCVYFSII